MSDVDNFFILLTPATSRIFKQREKPIIVIAATNKPWDIDPAFLRPGRFDKKFPVGLPEEDARIDIIKLQLRNRAHALTESDILAVAKELDGYSGADIENIIEEAAFTAFNRRAKGNATIYRDDVDKVIETTPRSVTPDELEEFKKFARERGLKINDF